MNFSTSEGAELLKNDQNDGRTYRKFSDVHNGEMGLGWDILKLSILGL